MVAGKFLYRLKRVNDVILDMHWKTQFDLGYLFKYVATNIIGGRINILSLFK